MITLASITRAIRISTAGANDQQQKQARSSSNNNGKTATAAIALSPVRRCRPLAPQNFLVLFPFFLSCSSYISFSFFFFFNFCVFSCGDSSSTEQQQPRPSAALFVCVRASLCCEKKLVCILYIPSTKSLFSFSPTLFSSPFSFP